MIAMSILAAVAVILLLPYIKRAIGRGKTIRALRKISALRKYKLEISNPFCVYFRNFSKNYDLTVDTGKVLYAVKFWDEYYKNSTFVFSGTRSVSRVIKGTDVFDRDNKHTAERRLGKFYKLSCNNRGRYEINLFLVNTDTTAIFYFEGGNLERLKEGDLLYGMRLTSHKAFLEGVGKPKA